MDSLELSKQAALEKLPKGIPNLDTLHSGILEGNKVMLGKAITLVESKLPAHRELANELITRCLTHTGKSHRIGITGVPGVGKSTFINLYTQILLTEGHKVAILAVDPTSRHTGGSILGDKTRMEDIYAHPNVMIRPSPAGETLGGVTARTRETILLCEAAGYDRILIETVGVGQSETAVHSMTDIFVLLMLPGGGDELQGIKRGIMELADVVVIHKADQNNLKKAEMAKADYSRALHLFPPSPSGWTPRVIMASSTEGSGVDQVAEAIDAYFLHTISNGYLESQRIEQRKEWFHNTLENCISEYIFQNPDLKELYSKEVQLVAGGTVTPYKAAQNILGRLFKQVRYP
jgi:LAO/AO transport system kinase